MKNELKALLENLESKQFKEDKVNIGTPTPEELKNFKDMQDSVEELIAMQVKARAVLSNLKVLRTHTWDMVERRLGVPDNINVDFHDATGTLRMERAHAVTLGVPFTDIDPAAPDEVAPEKEANTPRVGVWPTKPAKQDG